jgi:glycosyltransferase involved in cell wall biosynthesis
MNIEIASQRRQSRVRILSVHNLYQIRGGEDESRESEEKLLKEYGHQVDIYLEDNTRLATMNSLDMVKRTVWSTESFRAIQQRLREVKYDIVHVQNFFPLISPSVHYAAQELGVPVVQTLRNYRLLCPNALFFRDGKVCEDCLGKLVPYPGIVHGCYRQSRAASAAVVAMLTVHKMMHTWQKQVNVYIALTEFARQKLIEGGVPQEKIIVKPNFVNPDPGFESEKEGYALFVGRLSVEKGLDTLLAAWETLSGAVPLKIVGDGPLSETVSAVCQRLPNVEWMGLCSISEVYRLMGKAMFVIVPSKWYETFGRVAVEAFAKGTPVIASNIGALAELVDHQRTGLKFIAGNSEDLAAKVNWLINSPSKRISMGQNARKEFESRYSASENYSKLIEIYNQAINS